MTADEYAKSIGYYGAGSSFSWNGMRCRHVIATKDPLGAAPRTGCPVFIIKTADGWRESTGQESYEYVFGE